jgi:uncharacterized protein DUF4038
MMSNILPYHWQRVRLTILYISGILVLDLIWWKDNSFFSTKAYSAPSPGQIVVDPNKPAWLKYYQGGPFFMCGPGGPEDFLYRGTMNPDGTRNGGQLALIDKLRPTGANSIYLIAVRSHGGDGNATQNPFINNDPAKGINQKVLDQWETWFTKMDNNGIVIFFVFYDDGAAIWGLNSSGNLQAKETNFIQALVDRFKHHKHLVWVVAEEYEEMDLGKPFAIRNSRLHVSKIAEAIRRADTGDHPIAVHQVNGLTFAFPNDPNVDQFAIQYTADSPGRFHSAIVSAWNNAAGRYNLNLAEYHPEATGVAARKNSWAIAMGGAYVMHLRWTIANNTLSDLRDCGRLVSFMESTNINKMSPHDDLKYADTAYVLAVPGSSYIAYTFYSSSGKIGLRNMVGGRYNFIWFSPKYGTRVIKTDVIVKPGTNIWPVPLNIGKEVAVYIKRIL